MTDTLSSLFRGMAENKADDWELVLPWLLDMRRRGITVLLVAHAGRNGDHMRGTSRREDDAFWIISVRELSDRPPGERGARFETEFTKCRNADIPPMPRRWSFNTEADGTVSCNCEELSFDDKVLELIQAGMGSVTAIADALKVDKAKVWRAASRLLEKRLIEKQGSGSHVTYVPRGFMRNGGGQK